MYFASRVQAGRMLAAKLTDKYKSEKCTVLALGDGATVVAEQIAKSLKCPLVLLLSDEIILPREPKAVGGITASGTFSYNHSYSEGEIDELAGEYRNFIESEKLTRMHELNQLSGDGQKVGKKILKDQNVIVVSDGLKTGFEVDLTAQFLKPVDIKKLVIATPLSSVPAVDRMHILADDLYCLSVIVDYFETDHYYDADDVPEHDTVLKNITQII